MKLIKLILIFSFIATEFSQAGIGIGMYGKRHTIHTLDGTQRGKIYIKASREELDGTLEFRHYADIVAEFLQSHPMVERVSYPGIAKGQPKERAEKYLSGGNGGLQGFEIKGGIEAGKKFINSLEMVYHVANIGDARSLAIHPASTTHSQLNESELLAAGVGPGYVRLSIGIEHIDDIIADIEQA